MVKVFVEGSEGTTGLRIASRLKDYKGIEPIFIASDRRKDIQARKEALNAADIAILCLPDDAARESVALIENGHTKVLDTSTVHRTHPDWVYGFPEMSRAARNEIASARRVTVPGCHATGFIALAAPLVAAKLIGKGERTTCHSITGYSGGGKKMIAEYEMGGAALESPRQYALGQSHKHLKEMVAFSGLDFAPVFSPIVANFYAGMVVTIPLAQLDPKRLDDVLRAHYEGEKLVRVLTQAQVAALNGFLPANALAGRDDMEIIISGNSDRAVVFARFDNLGKGSSGAALQCLNLMLGNDEGTGLCIE